MELSYSKLTSFTGKIDLDGISFDVHVMLSEGRLEAELTSKQYYNFTEVSYLSGVTSDQKFFCLDNIIWKMLHGEISNIRAGISTHRFKCAAQYLAISHCRFDLRKEQIESIYIVNDNTSAICHDPNRMPHVSAPEKAIDCLVKAGYIDIDSKDFGWKSDIHIKLDTGPSFSANSETGQIIGEQAGPDLNFGAYSRCLDYSFTVGIEFFSPQNFSKAIAECCKFIRLCEFSYGMEIHPTRFQAVLDNKADPNSEVSEESIDHVDIYTFDLGFGTRGVSSDAWSNSRLGDWRDALVAPARNRCEFEQVTESWFESEGEKSEARARLLDGYRLGTGFSRDRLIGVCAAFELLPSIDRPKPNPPTQVLNLVKKFKQEINETNLDTDWANRFKTAVGGVKKSSTTDTILSRLKLIQNSCSNISSEWNLVVINAVKLRNRFIHGSQTKLTEQQNSEFLPFFTMTLETIFVLSELIECGYDFSQLRQGNYPQGNPVVMLIQSFNWHKDKLDKALAITN